MKKEIEEVFINKEVLDKSHAMNKNNINFEKACSEAMLNKDLVENYDRLCNSSLGKVLSATGINARIDETTGFKKEELIKFAIFFDEFVWSRLPPESFI